MSGARRSTSGKKRSPSARPAWMTGGCHCGAVRFRVRARPRAVLDCNCLVCVKKGNLHLVAAERDFELVSGRDVLTRYTFGARIAQHYFCSVCGIHPFHRPNAPPDPTRWDVNARCLDDRAMVRFRVEPLDGQGIEDSVVEALKAVLPKASLERRYVALCERGIYRPSAQAARLGVSAKALDGIVLRLQRAIAGIGARLAAQANAGSDAPRATSRRRYART